MRILKRSIEAILNVPLDPLEYALIIALVGLIAVGACNVGGC